ncbi:MAG TPA: hypothetical protein VF002_09600 [Gaiellaceae bacterium]
MSSAPAQILGLAGEPPLSPSAEEGVELHEAPAPAAALRPPLEAELVQQGKLSMGQLAQAHRDRLEKGGAVLDIVVERGWVSAEDVAALRAEHGLSGPLPRPAPAPAPVPAAEEAPPPAATASPEPVAAPEALPAPIPAQRSEDPEPLPEPPPDLAAAVTALHPVAIPHRVAIRLTNGELVAVGEADDEEKAQAVGQAVISELAAATQDEWPFFNGRYLRPETILSVDIVVAEPDATS